MTAGALRFPHALVDKGVHSPECSLDRQSFLKFRARQDTTNGVDAHREYTGSYFPRFRSLLLNEVRDAQVRGVPKINLVPVYKEDVYLKEDGDYFYTSDFVVGTKLSLGRTKQPTILTGQAAQKVFVITDVDKSRLRYNTHALPQHDKPPKPAPVQQALEKVRNRIRERAGGKLTVKGIARHFRVIDDSGDRKLDGTELRKALKEYDIGLSGGEIDMVIDALDKDDDGMVSLEEFMEGVRGPMSEERRMCVAAAFKKVDYNKDGVLTLDDLRQFYCAKYHPKVLNGEVTEEDMLRRFLDKFDTKDKNGVVTYDEFCDYYAGVSANIDDDDHFIFMMERAWNLDNRNDTKTPFR